MAGGYRPVRRRPRGRPSGRRPPPPADPDPSGPAGAPHRCSGPAGAVQAPTVTLGRAAAPGVAVEDLDPLLGGRWGRAVIDEAPGCHRRTDTLLDEAGHLEDPAP